MASAIVVEAITSRNSAAFQWLFGAFVLSAGFALCADFVTVDGESSFGPVVPSARSHSTTHALAMMVFNNVVR
ncbi:hypothetical protein J2046_005562 [Rhizobium petrolearium]|nr:hypothetical protein [Neorhizobium petrolearium]